MMALINQGTALHVTLQGVKTRLGLLRSVSELKLDSDMVDVTTLDAPGGFRMYAQGLKSVGDLTVDGYLSREENSQQVLRDMFLSGAQGQFEISFPDGETCTFTALCKSVSLGGGEVDAVSRFSAVLKITGEVQFS